MQDTHDKVEPRSLLDILAPENLTDFRHAAAEAGLPRLSYWVMLRAWRAGKLEALKIDGRIMTTGGAVRRWIERSNQPSNEQPIEHQPPRRTATAAANPLHSCRGSGVLRSTSRRRIPRPSPDRCSEWPLVIVVGTPQHALSVDADAPAAREVSQ